MRRMRSSLSTPLTHDALSHQCACNTAAQQSNCVHVLAMCTTPHSFTRSPQFERGLRPSPISSPSHYVPSHCSQLTSSPPNHSVPAACNSIPGSLQCCQQCFSNNGACICGTSARGGIPSAVCSVRCTLPRLAVVFACRHPSACFIRSFWCVAFYCCAWCTSCR